MSCFSLNRKLPLQISAEHICLSGFRLIRQKKTYSAIKPVIEFKSNYDR